VWNDLGQYNKTNGIINGLVARQLELDEGIRVRPESIMVTHGCQEAMTVLLLGLFDPARDVLLVSDPTYIGITGLAGILGIETVPIPTGEDGLAADAVAAAIAGVRRAGKRPRALYDIPDFNNPLGTQMPLTVRRALLALLHAEEVLLFEDNPYGMFSYDGDPLPTLKALDEHGVVVYLGSFSKTLYPGLRAGYLIADQEVVGPAGQRTSLADELSKVKSLTTVTTAPVVQAVVGAQLLANGGSLRELVRGKLPFYRGNRDRMLACLERELGGAGGMNGVRWNRPAGGFFLTVNLPFAFEDACLQACARDYGVVVCPMSYFALTAGREAQVRLSFSYVTEEQIEEGIGRFARFVRDRAAAP
jgi:(S)-3,5-dihydroxyphenylglycine transaminase